MSTQVFVMFDVDIFVVVTFVNVGLSINSSFQTAFGAIVLFQISQIIDQDKVKVFHQVQA